MPIGNTLEAKMRYRINKSKISAIISSDFYDLSDRDQVGRILRKFVKQILKFFYFDNLTSYTRMLKVKLIKCR